MKSKTEGYPSRAAYKLIVLYEKYRLIRQARHVVELGVAPGGWAQVVKKLSPKAQVVGIDLLPTDAIPDVTLFQMDIMDERAPDILREALGAQPDLILSDMAAKIGRASGRDRVCQYV